MKMPSLFERVTGRNVPSPDSPDVIERCLFCHVSAERDFSIVAENDKFVVFRDKYPSARVHLLVTPRAHIPNTSNLGQGHVEMVKEMLALGTQALDSVRVTAAVDEEDQKKKKHKDGQSGYVFGFHVPPFRSVDHLHLHCQQLPYLSRRQGLKYPILEPSGKSQFKGTGWFVTAQQAIDILSSGQKIGFGSC
ncbi:unnamed protein product [Tilletia laevis]|nr:hypothetical protein CF335_g6835 [Tilletia laevis]CAD6892218.1 unnamed protein product [Tilletia caries]CAD6917311.1 unnamed protein product [Tilletia controversa]CAD6898745.1 unnamed protein product [Tilletia laevis]CAD6951832.1 unnamed protein product [Tilletia controversa]